MKLLTIKNLLTCSFVLGITLNSFSFSPITNSKTTLPNFSKFLTGVITVRIEVTDENGESLAGVHVRLIQDGKTLSKVTTEKTSNVLSIADYNEQPVTIELVKEGYVTYLLKDIVVQHDRDYSFTLKKGEGKEEHTLESRISPKAQNEKLSFRQKRLIRIEQRLERRLEKNRQKQKELTK